MVTNTAIPRERLENLGPAEQTVQALTAYLDHMMHNRPGAIFPDTRANIGLRWDPVSWKLEGQEKIVYRMTKVGRKTTKTPIGVLRQDNKIISGGAILGEYRQPGLFPEVVTWMYRQVANIWKVDNEFAAHWASWAFAKDHRDMKVILAAFMLCQSRKGEGIKGPDGKVEFNDDDYRAIGEAMCLIQGKNDLNPKLLLRLGDVLAVPGVAEINRELGFGNSARTAFLGRYPKAVEKWLRYREENPKLLLGLVRAGFRTSVIKLAQRIGYKPTSATFFQTLRWKQAQAKDGRRTIAIGAEVEKADNWDNLTERQICNRIIKNKPSWKLLVGKLPATIGLTRAIMTAAIMTGGVSNADLLILTPTLEELELLKVPEVKVKHDKAIAEADNQRAANIARRVRKEETKELLQKASDNATKKAVEEVTRGLRVYVVVDKSGSMEHSLENAKMYLTKFLGGIPLDRIHVSVFNTIGQEITIKAASAAGVEQAFRGHSASGGTMYATGVQVLVSKYKPKEDEDALFLFVGDEAESNNPRMIELFRQSGVNPVAFGLLKVPGQNGDLVQWTARQMGIPCFMIDERIFTTNDPYAITRTLRNLIASTPVGSQPISATRVVPIRKSLVQEILETPLLEKPLAFR
jgi:hypothetical protein